MPPTLPSYPEPFVTFKVMKRSYNHLEMFRGATMKSQALTANLQEYILNK